MTEPYPKEWHRRLDFAPPLGLQSRVFGENDLQVYHLEAVVSVQSEKSITRDLNTEFGQLKISPSNRQYIKYEMGKPDFKFKIPDTLPQKAVLDDIMNYGGDAVSMVGSLPDVVIKSRSVVETIPEGVANISAFQGVDKLIYHQKAYGNFTHRIAKSLGMGALANPFEIIRNEMLTRGVIPNAAAPILKKLRSVLKTEWMIPDNETGYEALGDRNIFYAEQFLTQNRWWVDIGRPLAFQIQYNHIGLQGQIYQLLKHRQPVFI